MEEVWGIKITPNITAPANRGLVLASFNFEIAFGNPRARMFYSNPELGKFIKKTRRLHKFSLGHTRYLVDPKNKKVQLIDYFPFVIPPPPPGSKRVKARTKEKGALLDQLIGRGVASYLERAAVRHLNQKFPRFTYQEAVSTTKFRKAQLARRNIKPAQKMPLRDYWKVVQKTTRQWRQRKRPV